MLNEPPRPPCLRTSGDGFSVWADEYVRNESKSESTAGKLRRLIVGELRRLRPDREQVLYAAYGGERWPGSDIENLLFNNIDQTLSLFTAAGRTGLRFEDLGHQAPPAPDNTDRCAFYAYRLADRETGFTAVELDRLVCRVAGVVVPTGPARMAARVWFAVRRALPNECDAITARSPYILRIKTRGLTPATSVKALVDGASAAMQQAAMTDQLLECIGRLAPLLGVPTQDLLAYAAASAAPLGAATRLFALDGRTQVRVTPDDDRCIAAEVISCSREEPVMVAVDLYSAR